uniref:Uncharacterized protein n=1 Tax=Solanum lycopersicum TaxID=4081 RepID=K4B2Q2_SOLLC
MCTGKCGHLRNSIEIEKTPIYKWVMNKEQPKHIFKE